MNAIAQRARGRLEAALLSVAVMLLAVGGGLFIAGLHTAAFGGWALDTLVGIVPATPMGLSPHARHSGGRHNTGSPARSERGTIDSLGVDVV